MKPGIIAVPLDATRDGEILLLSMLINTTPGSVALDVSPDRKILYVHVMYMTTPDAARDEIKTGFERRVLGRSWLSVDHGCTDRFVRRRVDHARGRGRA